MTDEKQLKETLVTLTSLRELQLHGNELAKLNEATFAQNCNLEVISLGTAREKISSLEICKTFVFAKLTHFFLFQGHGNNGVKLPETVFVGATNVKILDLGAAFTNINPELLAPLTNLEYLFLQFNNVGRLSSRKGDCFLALT